MPARGALEAEDDADEGGLPAAVRPGDGDELALLDAQVDPLEHPLPGAVPERDPVERIAGVSGTRARRAARRGWRA